ncbi:hypothetical protein AXF42_Ash014497 [Apostasia shenzhenica]|uniref:Uncharacterized protein n=1 Tax=Apostasia shenzhenica TaxID=1088818 RepID=A0A2H9ZWN8_9ASPA|nr:hypothetical protein AXF42_Ash014497 [Apostasia shenzhenica]
MASIGRFLLPLAALLLLPPLHSSAAETPQASCIQSGRLKPVKIYEMWGLALEKAIRVFNAHQDADHVLVDPVFLMCLGLKEPDKFWVAVECLAIQGGRVWVHARFVILFANVLQSNVPTVLTVIPIGLPFRLSPFHPRPPPWVKTFKGE